jgi:hypothetical protein
MRYARGHVKRYWGFAYRRNIGISMVAFAMVLAIGVAFTSLIGSSLVNSALVDLIFWGMLVVIATLVLVASFVGAHIASVNLMNDAEHSVHSKYVGAWVALLAVGAIACVLPMLFFGSSMALLVFMFSLGGMLWVLYFSTFLLFRHAYHEVAIAALALWIVFVVSFTGAASMPGGVSIKAYSLFVSTVVVTTVMGITGMAMLFNASREFVSEFVQSQEAKSGTRHKVRRGAR